MLTLVKHNPAPRRKRRTLEEGAIENPVVPVTVERTPEEWKRLLEAANRAHEHRQMLYGEQD